MGQTLKYTIVVSNAGPSDAQNVVLTDAIPSEIINPEFSTDGGVTWNPWTGSYNIGTLANGASITILIRGTVGSSATGTISNTANITSTTPDPDLCNNTFTVISVVSSASADISVKKSAAPNPVAAGQRLKYRIVASNAGPSDAQNVVLTDAIPPEIINPEFSTDGGVTWNPWTGSYNIGTLPHSASVTILIRGTVDPSAAGTLCNTANITSTTPDPNPNNNTSTVNVFVHNYFKKSIICKK
nr:DUF11 domain-containing protein [Alkaliphilus sp. B6464]